jgi:hypothetical protein
MTQAGFELEIPVFEWPPGSALSIQHVNSAVTVFIFRLLGQHRVRMLSLVMNNGTTLTAGVSISVTAGA